MMDSVVVLPDCSRRENVGALKEERGWLEDLVESKVKSLLDVGAFETREADGSWCAY